MLRSLLASASVSVGRDEDARAILEAQAARAAEAGLPEDHPLLVGDTLRLAEALERLGARAEADEAFELAIELAVSRFGTASNAAQRAREKRAVALLGRGRLPEAARVAAEIESLDAGREGADERGPLLALLRAKLAFGRRDLATAEREFEAAQRAAAVDPATHISLDLAACAGQARCLAARGERDEALRVLEDGLRRRRAYEATGLPRPRCIEVMDQLVALLPKTEQDRRLALATEVLEELTKMEGADARNTRVASLNLASLAFGYREFARADRAYEPLFELEKTGFLAGRDRSLMNQYAFAGCAALRAGRPEVALPRLLRAYELCEKGLGFETGSGRQVPGFLVEAYTALERPEDAARLREKHAALFEK
ncbi:MAG: hypothetical protein R3F20_15275 [Planctomycetota bacterium]